MQNPLIAQQIDSPARTAVRLYSLDWLRVLAFSAVFFYHCSRFFDESDWHIKNSTTSALVDTLKGIFDLRGMPLIFVMNLAAAAGAAGGPRGRARRRRDGSSRWQAEKPSMPPPATPMDQSGPSHAS